MKIDMSALRGLEREKEISFDLVVSAIETALLTAYRHTEGAQPHARVELDRNTGEVAVLAQELGRRRQPSCASTTTPPRTSAASRPAPPSRSSCSGCARPRARCPTASTPAARATSSPASCSRRRSAPARRPTATSWSCSARARTRSRRSCRRPSRCRGRSTPTAAGSSAGSSRSARGQRGASVTLSRTHPDLVRGLFALEVPEIADGSVEIAALAREAGHRTKIAVRSTVAGLNAKGACIGPVGSRVRAVTTELHGEKIDIVDWSDGPGPLRGERAVARAGQLGRRSSTWRSGRPASSSPTTSSRSPSARRGRTPASRPG